ncbi:helix-turn-helix transcriptional regulator [Streptomyces iakyrus]|uniref:helix-turn-helix transcriptional regulator n=1 Tax=Streptomyces iakyrus TaxID=68219 RepID=UPI000525DF91|nr:helix-turn-helix transcriptional regulator [Streptomyces iakyrus]
MHQPDDDAWLTEHCRAIGDRIRAERLRQNRTQENVYLAAGISRFTLQEIEAGRANPTLKLLLRISRVLDTPLSNLV